VPTLDKRVQELEAEKRRLRQQACGRQTEKANRSDADWLKGLEDQPGARPRGQRPDRPGPQRRDSAHVPARGEAIELPLAERGGPPGGPPYREWAETEDSEPIAIEVKAYRRLIQRQREPPCCRCTGPWPIVTAPAPPKLLAKSRYGVSVWGEILRDKFVSQWPTERRLEAWRLLGLDWAAGTVTGGLYRLEPLLVPLEEALLARPQEAGSWQADETRGRLFVEQAGKVGHPWGLGGFLRAETVISVLDISRSRRVPQEHLADTCAPTGVLMVDRLASYKAIEPVKNGTLVLGFCWAHVRRDCIRVGKSWPPLKDGAWVWLRRIRDLYRLHHQRLQGLPTAVGTAAATTEAALRHHLDAMHQQALAACAEPRLHPACRKVLTRLPEPGPGLTRFVDDPRLPLDNNASERQLRGPVVGRKNSSGSGAVWSGRLAAMLFSLFATLERCPINARDWRTE
jgi:transposase